MLINGKWTGDWQPVQATDAKGGFVRQVSTFRNWVTPDGSAGPTGTGGFAAEAGRYHLYVALVCPWASRTLIARKIKGLEGAIPVSVVEPKLGPEGWRFGSYPGSTADGVNGATWMHEIYTRAAPLFTGRATVPVLWDRASRTIVNNESADILRMRNSGFGALASGPDLYPAALAPAIDDLNGNWGFDRGPRGYVGGAIFAYFRLPLAWMIGAMAICAGKDEAMVMLVSKPSGRPASARSCFAFSTSRAITSVR